MSELITKATKRLTRLLPGHEDDAVWCTVASVADGTKHFPRGTLVHCPTVLWGDGYEKIKVVARHRGSHRYVTMIILSARLTNWRVKLVYSPHVIREFREMGATWDGSGRSKRLASEIVERMKQRTKQAEPCSGANGGHARRRSL